MLLVRSTVQDGLTGLTFDIKAAGDKEVTPNPNNFTELQAG
jgi:hypothetical protein